MQADGACACPDAQHRGATCKHALAGQIHYLASAGLRPGGDHRQAPTAAPSPRASQPAPRSSAAWDVREAPASACFKFRVGSLELLYTLRGVSDAELLRRMAATLPTLQDVIAACEDRAAQRVAACEAAPAAPTAPPAPAAADAAAPAQPGLQALVQQALQAGLAQSQARADGHASPAAPAAPAAPPASAAPSAPAPDDQASGVCSLHQVAMEPRTDQARGERWYSHYCEETGRYCKGQRASRRSRR